MSRKPLENPIGNTNRITFRIKDPEMLTRLNKEASELGKTLTAHVHDLFIASQKAVK